MNTADMVMDFVPSLACATSCSTVPKRCVPVPLTAGEVKDCAVPPMVQVFADLLPMERLQSFTRYILQVMADVFADTSCDWLQSTRSV